MDQNDYNLGKRIIQQEENKAKNPFVFYKKDEPIKPFVKLDEAVNDVKQFAITKATENGKYIRGGQLWFKMNGVEIFVDIDSIIYVDLENNNFIVKDGKKVLNEITPTDPETRQYVLLMKCIDNNTEFYQWESMEGRTETYNYIVDNIDILNIYPEESFVLTENVALKDALTIAEFVRYLKNSELVEEDGFNIEEYIY